MKNVFYHLHVPKTGGTYLKSFFEFDLINKLKVSKIEFISEHAGWENVKDNTYVVTSWRDPAKRTVSHFVLWAKILEQPSDVDSFRNWLNKYSNKVSNYQSKIILSNSEDDPQRNFFYKDSNVEPDSPIEKNLVFERLKRIDLFIKDTQLDKKNFQIWENTILNDMEIKTNTFVDYNSIEFFKNSSQISQEIYQALSKEEIDALFALSDIDTEIYNNNLLFWKE